MGDWPLGGHGSERSVTAVSVECSITGLRGVITPSLGYHLPELFTGDNSQKMRKYSASILLYRHHQVVLLSEQGQEVDVTGSSGGLYSKSNVSLSLGNAAGHRKVTICLFFIALDL